MVGLADILLSAAVIEGSIVAKAHLLWQRVQLAFACADMLFEYFSFLASGMPVILDLPNAITIELIMCEITEASSKRYEISYMLGARVIRFYCVTCYASPVDLHAANP